MEAGEKDGSARFTGTRTSVRGTRKWREEQGGRSEMCRWSLAAKTGLVLSFAGGAGKEARVSRGERRRWRRL